MRYLILLLAVFSSMFGPAKALTIEEQQAEASRSMLAVSAFRCFVLAREADYPEEAERLFQLGYNEAIAFARSARANTISETVLRSNASTIFLMTLQGPNEEFIVGRLFASIENDIWQRYFEEQRYADVRKTIARNEFSSQNCSVIR
jgi:hypothetical protein